MSGIATSASFISGPSAAAGLPRLPTLALGKGAKAAREFEGQLIGALLESIEKTFAGLPGQDAIAGEDNYNYLGTHALATAIAEAGGFGIAKLITAHLPAEGRREHQGRTRRDATGILRPRL